MLSDDEERQLVADYIIERAPDDPRFRHLLKALTDPDAYQCICGDLREFALDRNSDGTTAIGPHADRARGTDCEWIGRTFAGFTP